MKKIILSVLSLAAPLLYAEPDLTASAIPTNLHIFNTSGHAYVDMPEKGCSNTRYILYTSHPRFSEIYSMILAAQMANKKIEIRFDGCNDNGQGEIIGAYLNG